MSTPSLTDTLSRGYTGIAAERARITFGVVLGAILIVEAAAALALLIEPRNLAYLLGFDATGALPLVRLAGLLLLLNLLFLALGRPAPARTKLINLLGIVERGVLAVALAILGGRLLWPAGFELIAALLIANFYYRYFQAEVMSRP
ncbi:hypothetical protein [Sphingomonas azotifigens]|uniref:hypothetical protein n=1 Tax=Sphingomonas azotifigens TaxID=330920 RepID=UPI000A0221CC|nr:hypothetical protein [Sphingomonas azotifigens]